MVIADQERGVVGVLADELAGLIGTMERAANGHGGKAERAIYLQAYDARTYSQNRVGRGFLATPQMGAVICGGIQPDVLKSMPNLSDDGLLQRFCIALLRPGELGDDCDDQGAGTTYGMLINELLTTPPSTRMELCDAALSLRILMEERVQQLQNNPPLNDQRFAGAVGKMTGIWGPFASSSTPSIQSVSSPRRAAGDCDGGTGHRQPLPHSECHAALRHTGRRRPQPRHRPGDRRLHLGQAG